MHATAPTHPASVPRHHSVSAKQADSASAEYGRSLLPLPPLTPGFNTSCQSVTTTRPGTRASPSRGDRTSGSSRRLMRGLSTRLHTEQLFRPHTVLRAPPCILTMARIRPLHSSARPPRAERRRTACRLANTTRPDTTMQLHEKIPHGHHHEVDGPCLSDWIIAYCSLILVRLFSHSRPHAHVCQLISFIRKLSVSASNPSINQSIN